MLNRENRRNPLRPLARLGISALALTLAAALPAPPAGAQSAAKSKASAAKPTATKPSPPKSSPPMPLPRATATPAAVPTVAVPTPPPRPDPRQPRAAVAAVAPADQPAMSTMPALPLAKTTATTAIDIAAVRRAIALVRGRKQAEAVAVRDSIRDPVASKLVEWVILRSDDAGASFARFAEFVVENPAWPSIVTLRRKAESMAYSERPDANAVRRFFATNPPLSPRGRIAHARALAAVGERAAAHAVIRQTWRSDFLSADMEELVLKEFGSAITAADHKARMDYRLYQSDDTAAGLRAAKRVGGHAVVIAQARAAVLSGKGGAALVDKVPAAAHDDMGYRFARIQMLRRANRTAEAVKLLATVPKLDDSHDLDQWWIERRLLVRRLLEDGNAKTAYIVARDATTPARANYQVEHQFMAGWVALRFLNDPKTAYGHFRRIPEGQQSPISLARGYYWMGRAMEAMGRDGEARTHYQQAARYPTAYYGQIARAKAGQGELAFTAPPALTADQRGRARRLEVVRAATLLYAADAQEMAHPFLADLGDKLDDVPALLALAELATKHKDARGLFLVGRLALSRGLPLEHAAFPAFGVPSYSPIGPEVERALVYAIARQESQFNPQAVSSAKAMGLMQVMPATARGLAKRYKVPFDQGRLLNDAAYNVQLGAAELGGVLEDHRGSYILAFVAYNAGRSRARDWIARFGDPRSPKVDPIDWVERIPFAETRNYVQRVMENVQVYRALFDGSQRLLIEADLRRGATR